MMAAYYTDLSKRDNMQSPYSGDQKYGSYTELPSQGSDMAIYMNQASTAGSYSEFLSRSSLFSQNCAEFPSVEARNEMIFIPTTTMNLQSIDEHLSTAGNANSLVNSKYLKAAQQLLDEVVSVRKALKQPQSNPKETDGRPSNQSVLPVSSGISSGPRESVTNSTSELSPAEQQHLQNKKSKLLSMLDEVDRRYRQYYHQMQFVVSSFDMVVGHEAAKSYTALALQTISRHFRCLRDAVSRQVEITSRRLGEEYPSSNGIPRLRFVDQQLRQQRALQHLGVMRHAWRPQRGLPESSVSVLRAWLFEHFLHPYPNDSEKIMLSKQTRLTRNQVANWFINARVRLWKPMVEDIYKEEFGYLEANSKSSQDDASQVHRENYLASKSRLDELRDSLISAATLEMDKPIPKSSLQNSSDEEKLTAESGIMKFQHDHSHYPDTPLQYGISALNGFAIGNQVTLALGLEHHETDAFSMSGGTHIGGNNVAVSSMGSDTVDYHCMDPGKQQDRFGNLLHDFVV